LKDAPIIEKTSNVTVNDLHSWAISFSEFRVILSSRISSLTTLNSKPYTGYNVHIIPDGLTKVSTVLLELNAQTKAITRLTDSVAHKVHIFGIGW